MTWECAECNNTEGKRADAGRRVDGVCHHCGKPLCHDDQILIADEAFTASPGEANREAVHCPECWREHHPGSISLGKDR